jgi:G3E family GTPase
VHTVTGAPGAGKTQLIARLCRERPDWLGLVNALPAEPHPSLRQLGPGCPCCTGKLVLAITLARALRETRAVRVFVEIQDTGHAAMLEKVLGEAPLNLSLGSARGLALPEVEAISVIELEKTNVR